MNCRIMGIAGAGIRVMVVNDHRLLLLGLQQLIDEQRPQMELVGLTNNAAEAITMTVALAPHVVLLGSRLELVNAIDILPELVYGSKCRALVMVGDDCADDPCQLVRAGASGVIRGTAEPALIIKAIEKTFIGELWLDREAASGFVSESPRGVQDGIHNRELQKQSALTPREREVVQALVRHSDCINKTLAQHLFISEQTLRNHLSSIYQKLGVKTRLDLYAYAVRFGLAPLPVHVHT